jgi:hypothetical protein
MENRFRPPFALVPLPALFGTIALFSVMNGPGYETMRFLDIVRLITAGFGFGATFTAFIVLLVRSRT